MCDTLIGVALCCSVLFFYITFEINENRKNFYLNKLKNDLEEGICQHCGHKNIFLANKMKFWTILRCFKCNKISKAHFY